MKELWDYICAAWDDETLTTEDIRRLADMIMPAELLYDVHENIDAMIHDI